MVTDLQRQFAKSKVLQRLIFDQLEQEQNRPIPDKSRGVWRRAIQQAFISMPESQINYFLFSLWQCSDITESERAEILRLLQIAETALTKDQLQQIVSLLEAD